MYPMDTNSIMCVFRETDSYTKIPFSITCQKIYNQSKMFIMPLGIAVSNSDIFSIFKADGWYNMMDEFYIAKTGSEFLLRIYSRHHALDADAILAGAACGGHLNLVNMALSQGATHLDRALFEACHNNHVSVAKTLLQNGAGSGDLDTYLGTACLRGYTEMFDVLVEYGADDWDVAVDNACRGGHFELVKRLFKHELGDIRDLLESACIGGNIKIVKFLINYGFDDWNGGLLGACRSNSIEIMELMIKRGADNYNHGLYIACYYGSSDAIDILIGHADISYGLAGACAGQHDTIKQRMIAAGARYCTKCNTHH